MIRQRMSGIVRFAYRKLVVVALLLPAGSLSAEGTSVVWSDQPVVILPNQPRPRMYFEHMWGSSVYPLGNGRLGCTIYGGMAEEHIQFNEDTLWTGDEDNTGAFQNFGELFIALEGHADASPAWTGQVQQHPEQQALALRRRPAAVFLAGKGDERVAAGQIETLRTDKVGLFPTLQVADLHHVAVAMLFQGLVDCRIAVPAQHHHVAESQRAEIQYPPLVGRIDQNMARGRFRHDCRNIHPAIGFRRSNRAR